MGAVLREKAEFYSHKINVILCDGMIGASFISVVVKWEFIHISGPVAIGTNCDLF